LCGKLLSFLIDTGSTISLINNYKLKSPIFKTNYINIKTIKGNVNLNKIQYLYDPLLTPGKLKFYVFNFSDKFDGLIGFDILKVLNAEINLSNNKIRLNNKIYDLTPTNEEQNYNLALSKNPEIAEIHHNKKQSKFRLEHLNEEEKFELQKILNRFNELFHADSKKLTFTSSIKHKINTKHEEPIFSKLYRYPQVHKIEVNKQIKEMLEQGIIRNSESPYCAPLWVVPKKLDSSGKQKWRIVIDYRKLNDITTNDKFPIPNIDDILDKLGRSMYFTTLDLAKGFHQVELDETSCAKTAFSTQEGHYEFTRMPFGLKNAPATFQRLMNTVLGNLIGKICMVYLDDIIIFSTSLQEHLQALCQVLQKLKEANLKIQLDKCEFLKKETEFLGHIVTQNGIKPNPNKIQAIINFPIPKTEKEIKSFLGLAAFIENLSKILHQLLNH